jgi:hypothetical protein
MAALNLPDDLRAFLDAERQLAYDAARCECGAVALVPLDQLTLGTLGARVSPYSDLIEEDPHAGERGVYVVPAVSLVGACRGYWPGGLLVWLPESEVYGSFDRDHRVLWVFPGITWTDIVADPVPYINACWHPRAVHTAQLRLWECCEYQP